MRTRFLPPPSLDCPPQPVAAPRASTAIKEAASVRRRIIECTFDPSPLLSGCRRLDVCQWPDGVALSVKPLKAFWLRSAGSFGLALPLLIVLLSTVGYVVTSETIRSDRDSDLARRVEVDTVGAEVILGR